MATDRPSKRKSTPKRAPTSQKRSGTKKRSKTQTADDLEALLALLDKSEVPTASSEPVKTTPKAAVRRKTRRTKDVPLEADNNASFLGELASARAELHKERRARIAIEEKTEAIRQELSRIAASDSEDSDALRREGVHLQKQLAKLGAERQKLQVARTDLTSQLAAETAAREVLAAELNDARRQIEQQAIEAEATVAAVQTAGDELQLKLASTAAQLKQSQSEVAELMHSVSELEQQNQHERATRQQVEQSIAAHKLGHEAAQSALETRISEMHLQLTHLREQLASSHHEYEATLAALAKSEQQTHSNERKYEAAYEELLSELSALKEQLATLTKKLADSTANEQQLRTDLTDTRHEKRKTTILLDETIAAKDRLERRVDELESELLANNHRQQDDQNTAEAANEQLERLQSDLAKARINLAESYEQLGVARLRLANSDRDRDHAIERSAAEAQKADELSDQIKSLQAAMQREAAARRKAEGVHRREPGDGEASALFIAEQKIDRLTHELAASKSVEAAYERKAARKVQQAQQEIEALRRRLAELEQHRPTN